MSQSKDLSWIDFNHLLADPSRYAKLLTVPDLEKLLLTLKDYYYNNHEPLVPDYIYDELEDALRDIHPTSKVLSLTDAASSKGATVKLPYYMHSQRKAKADSGDIQRYFAKYPGPYLVSHKLDGESIEFVYDTKAKGSKLKLYTRGKEGQLGHDVTRHAKALDLGKYHFPGVTKVAIRGEFIVPKTVWDKHYSQQPHVRNWVAGKINDKNPNRVDLKRIQMVAYEVLDPIMKPSEQFKKLKEWGFHVAPYVEAPTLDEDLLKKMLTDAKKHGPYQIDGLIVNQDQINPKPTGDERPKYSIAYKMQMEGDEAQTNVKKVLWEPSKDGFLKPVVIFQPVYLSGATLQRATAHNAKYVVDNKIGPGSKITIIRSGEVIPYIKSVDRPAPRPGLPELKPEDYDWAADGLNFKLKQKKTNTTVQHKILVHMTKHLGIDHLGPGVLQKLVDLGYLTPADVLNIGLEELQLVDGLGKNAEKIWASLEKLKTKGVKLAVLMDASNIFPPGIGTKILQSVLDEIPDLLDRTIGPKLKAELIAIPGIQEKSAEKIMSGLSEFNDFLDEIPDIRVVDLDSDSESESTEAGPTVEAFNGMRVVFTGIRDKDLEEIISNSGGTVADGVSKTHGNQVVVAKDPDANSNKLKTARSLGVEIYSLADFRKKYLD